MITVQPKPLHGKHIKSRKLNNTNFCYFTFSNVSKKAKNPLFYFS